MVRAAGPENQNRRYAVSSHSAMRTYHRVLIRLCAAATNCYRAVGSTHSLRRTAPWGSAVASGAFECTAVGQSESFVRAVVRLDSARSRVESIFHWYLGQRKNDRSGCLADFAVALPRLGVGEAAGAVGTGSSCLPCSVWVMRCAPYEVASIHFR